MDKELDPMTFEFKIKGCPYRDSRELKTYVEASELHSALLDIYNEIRSRRKYEENVSDHEEKFLERLIELIPNWINE